MAYEKGDNHITVSIADVESTPRHDALRAEENPGSDQRCCIHFHHRRRRLCDTDGISLKYAIDGLVAGSLLRDDNAHIVKEISQSQEIGKADETVIEIEFIDN